MEEEPDDEDLDLDDEDEEEEDDVDPFYPRHCLKAVLRSGHEVLLNIDPPYDAKRVWRVLMDDERRIDHLEFTTNRNHVWMRLEHVLFAELIDDPAADEAVIEDGALVRYATGLERVVDLPEPDHDDEWEQTAGEALGLALSFTTYAKSVAYQTLDATTVHLNTEAAEHIVWGREEALSHFDAEEWAKTQKKRQALSSEAREHIKELATKRPPPTKRKPMRRRMPARWR